MERIFLIFAFSLSISGSSFLNENETAIAIELMKEIKVDHCIVILEGQKKDLILDTKEFSSEKISIMFMNSANLSSYLENIYGRSISFYAKTGVIFKENSNFTVDDLLDSIKYFDEVSIFISSVYIFLKLQAIFKTDDFNFNFYRTVIRLPVFEQNFHICIS